MAKAIKRGKQEKKFGAGPFSIGPKGRLLVWIAEPPPKFRIRAPKGVRPPARIDDPLQLLPAFLKSQDEWERLMREQQGLHLGKIKIGALTSPFRARLAAALPWMMAHQRRHLLQAEKVKATGCAIASLRTSSKTNEFLALIKEPTIEKVEDSAVTSRNAFHFGTYSWNRLTKQN